MSVPPVTSATAAGAAGATAADTRLHEAATGFEGLLMSHLVDEMLRASGAATTSPIYSGLMSEKLGDALADAGGIGLAAILERQVAEGGGTPAATDGGAR